MSDQSLSDSSSDDEHPVHRARKELEQLKKTGISKQTRYQTERERYEEVHHHLFQEWKRTRDKTPLHQYITAVRTSECTVPSKVLSQQAKLCQCLHLREVYMGQKTLIESHNRSYAELLAEQCASQEEERSAVSLKVMNELCAIDQEVKAMQEEMKDLGFNVTNSGQIVEEELQEVNFDSDGQDEEDSKQDDHDEEDDNSSEMSDQKAGHLGQWLWSAGSHQQEEPKPKSGDSVMSDEQSQASSVLSSLSLQWWSGKKPGEKQASSHSVKSDEPASDVSEEQNHKQPPQEHHNDGKPRPWWQLGKPQETSKAPEEEEEKTEPDEDDEAKEEETADDGSVQSEASYEAKPVARQWWPVVKPEEKKELEEVLTPVVEPVQRHGWWPLGGGHETATTAT